MKRSTPILLALVAFLGVILGGLLTVALHNRVVSSAALPTIASLPSATATNPITPTLFLTDTSLPTATSTLATLVLKMTSVNSDVTLQPVQLAANATSISTSLPTVVVPTPPVKLAVVPSGDTPLVGWYEYDVHDPKIQYQGQWALF